MIKAEISEIKKQLTISNCTISSLAGCLVSKDHVVSSCFKGSIATLSENSAIRYMDIFRKMLTGKKGKILWDIPFTRESELEGGHTLLMELRSSRLNNTEALEKFYEKVTESYISNEPYAIILASMQYDVPGKMDDDDSIDSEEVFNCIFCAVCPVAVSKEGLSCIAVNEIPECAEHVPEVQPPLHGFLFPEFNDRSSDIHNMLYYIKNGKTMQHGFVEAFTGTKPGMSFNEENTCFKELMGNAGLSYDSVCAVGDELYKRIEEARECGAMPEITCSDIEMLLSEQGVDKNDFLKSKETFEKKYGSDYRFHAENLVNAKKYKIDTPDVSIQVSPECAGAVTERFIGGKRCLVIEISGDVAVNGIRTSL